MTPNQLAKARAQAAYNAAADHYDQPALAFWEKFGRLTVARLNLRPGARVLDACCGSGASALPAAEMVGSTGRVLGVDLADGLIELARAKARQRGLEQIEFVTADFEQLGGGNMEFDAVICVFGIFFVPDMPAAVRRFWSLVRPGGQMAITTWGPRVFEPANSIFWETVHTVRPELYKGFNPWDRINEPVSVQDLLQRGGVPKATVVAVPDWHTLKTPEDWWTIVLGSGYRGVVEQLTPLEQVRVREAVLSEVRRQDIRRIEANVVYAIARKD